MVHARCTLITPLESAGYSGVNQAVRSRKI